MSTTTMRKVTLTHISELSRQQQMGVLGGVLLGILLAALDQTIVGTAMPRVIADLHGLERYSWVFTAYMLTSTTSMPIWGKLSDIYGRKWFYIGSMALFVFGSMLSGVAQTMDQLIIFRALQGLGAGAMMPIAQAIIGDIFTPAERGKYQGLTGAVFGLASVLGPTLGGYITDNLNWRWAFYINLPVGIVAIAVVYLTLPHIAATVRRVIDYLGSALLVIGIVPLLLAFTWAGSTYAWTSLEIIGLFVFAALMLSLFLRVERRATEPVVPLSLFRNDIFSVSALASFLAGAGMFGAILYIGLFVQGVLGQSATTSGGVLTPTMLGLIVASVISGQLMSRRGRYRIIAVVGLSIAALGMFLLAQMDVNTSMTTVIINMTIVGIGLGATMALFTIAVQNAVDYRVMGVATSTLNFFRSIGGTIGAAILGSFLTSTFTSEFSARLPQSVRQALPGERLAQLQPEALLSSQAMAQMRAQFAQLGPAGASLFNQILDTIRGALAVAIHDVFLAGTLVMVLAAVACIFLREIPLRRSVRGGMAAAASEAGVSVPLDAPAMRASTAPHLLEDSATQD